MSLDRLDTISLFWRKFTMLSLYDVGFADFVQSCGATKIADTQEAVKAMAYLKGAADMARVANTYMSPKWQIANLLGIAAATLSIFAETREDNDKVERVCETYERELKELLSK